MNTQKINSGARGPVKPPGDVRLNLPLALMLLLVAAPIIAEDRPYARADRVEAKIQTEIKRQEIVGLAVVVIDDGKVSGRMPTPMPTASRSRRRNRRASAAATCTRNSTGRRRRREWSGGAIRR